VGVYRIGDQRVGVVLDVPELDGDGNPVVDEYGAPQVTTTTVWVDKACFELQTPSEVQNQTVTTSEIGWAMLPIADRIVPAVDDDDQPAPFPFFNTTSGKPTISSSGHLIHNGLRYVMRGDAVLEQDIRGRDDHVFCLCEREQG
jgi:hypothetical protein